MAALRRWFSSRSSEAVCRPPLSFFGAEELAVGASSTTLPTTSGASSAGISSCAVLALGAGAAEVEATGLNAVVVRCSTTEKVDGQV